MSTLKKYIRSNNWKTWGSMSFYLAGFFVPTLLNAVYNYNMPLYWGLFAFSNVFLLIFLFKAFKYVDEWHHIIVTLRENNPSLYKAVSLFTVMRNAKREGYTNNVIDVKNITVKYLFYDKAYDFGEDCYYPFSVAYEVSGKAKKRFSTLYFHVLGQKSNPNIRGIITEINGTQVSNSSVNSMRDVQRIRFCAQQDISEGEDVSFKIVIPYAKTYGLISNRTQMFHFYPQNISCYFGKNATAHIELVYPRKLFENHIEKEFNISLYKYLDGLKEDTHSKGFDLGTKNEGDNKVLYHDIYNDYDDMRSLYLIEFQVRN